MSRTPVVFTVDGGGVEVRGAARVDGAPADDGIRLEVAVDDAPPMGARHRLARPHEDVDPAPQRLGVIGDDPPEVVAGRARASAEARGRATFIASARFSWRSNTRYTSP